MTEPLIDLHSKPWHAPMVIRRSDGRWGVFCDACSRAAGKYVDRCVVNPGQDWPPLILDGESDE